MNAELYINKLLEIVEYKDKKNFFYRKQEFEKAAGFRDLEKKALEALNIESNATLTELMLLIRDSKIKLLTDDKLE